MKVWQLVLILIAVVGGGVLFVGAAAGWFNGSAKVLLSSEYDCADEACGKMENLSGEEYEALVNEKKSFVVFVDQAGCKTSGKLREYLTEYAKEKGCFMTGTEDIKIEKINVVNEEYPKQHFGEGHH